MTGWFWLLPPLLMIPADIDATQFVAETRSAEVVWHGFPGFVADIEIEWDGKNALGRIIVQPDGRIYLEHLPEHHRNWAQHRLCPLIQQRLAEFVPTQQVWMFVNSPKGRAVCRSDAPFGPCIWIENNRMVAIDVRVASSKQRLTTLKTQHNRDGKSLPIAQVSHCWNTRTCALEATETTLLAWDRVGGFDLPASLQILSASAQPAMGRMVLSRHQLFSSSEPLLASR